jgi:ElaB/YqjD/DUF883 family membrane-anchored ribosome-binding protein
MTETMGTTPGGATPTSGDASTRDVAKEEARGVAQDAVQSGKQTAETAKQQAGEVAGEAMSQARMLLDQTRDQVTQQGAAQQERAASGLRSLADELQGMISGQGVPQEGLATDLARQASERIRSVADQLENRQPGELLEEVRRFARRRPGAFLLGAAAIGFLGGRVTRGIADEARDDSGQTPLATRTAPTAGLPANSPTNATGVYGGVQSESGYATTPTTTTTTPPVATGVSQAAPAGPGYSVTPETDVDPAGDATAQFTTTDSNTQRDQMPSEFGARGTSASGNSAEEGRI